MRTNRFQSRIQSRILAVATAVLAALLFSCGQVGGGSGGPSAEGGIGGSGISTGPITAFGSIFVNDIEWFIDESEIEFDEEMGGEDDLRIGMVVRVEGEINREDGIGHATRVFFDDEIEGPIESISDVGLDGLIKDLVVLGQIVRIEAGVTHFDVDIDVDDDDENDDSDFGFDTIAEGDVIEVSGLIDHAGRIRATYIELEGFVQFGVTEIEFRGTISGFDEGGSSFMIGPVTVNFDPTGVATDLSDLPGGVQDDIYVEVEGRLTAAREVEASEIELEDEFDHHEDEDEVSLTGFVQSFMGIDDFFVGQQAVDASGAEFENGNASMLEDGTLVEVDGEIVDGVLIADEIEFESDVEISAAIASGDDIEPGNARLFILGIEVRVSPSSRLEDSQFAVEPFGLGDLVAGDFIEIRGVVQGDGVVIAREIKRDEPDDIELRGPVDAFDAGTGEIVVLGVSISTAASTEYKIDESSISRSEFFERLKLGDRVKIVDEEEDGDATTIDFASKVEIDD